MTTAPRAVRLGDAATRWFYVVLLAAALLSAALAAVDRPWALLALLSAVVAIAPARQVLGGADGPALIPVLGATGRVQLVYGVLLTVGLALG